MKTNTQSFEQDLAFFKPVIIPFIIFVFILFCMNGCYIDTHHDIVDGDGRIETVTRHLPDFDSIESDISANIYLTQDNTQHVEISAPSDILNVLRTEVKNRELRLYYDARSVETHNNVNVYIRMPKVYKLQLDGAGNISTSNNFTLTRSCDLIINGSGNINFNVNNSTYDIYSYIFGSGDIDLSGSAATHKIKIAGSGRVRSYSLNTENTYIDVAGSGTSYVYVTSLLDVSIVGSGYIYYKGSPKKINQSIIGTGGLIKAD